jgi:hypothetical protein
MTSNTAEALIATSHYAIKSTVGAFPSTTYLGQCNINIITQTILNPNNESSLITNDNISKNIQLASAVSGLPIETCQQIILQFDQIKQNSLLSEKPKFQRQRSHSTSALD